MADEPGTEVGARGPAWGRLAGAPAQEGRRAMDERLTAVAAGNRERRWRSNCAALLLACWMAASIAPAPAEAQSQQNDFARSRQPQNEPFDAEQLRRANETLLERQRKIREQLQEAMAEGNQARITQIRSQLEAIRRAIDANRQRMEAGGMEPGLLITPEPARPMLGTEPIDVGPRGPSLDVSNGEAVGALADSDELIRLDFEELDLAAFVEYVSTSLGLNIFTIPELEGKLIKFYAPIEVTPEELVVLLQRLLADQGFALVLDPSDGIYRIVPQQSVTPVIGEGAFATSRLVPTPLVRPSVLRSPVQEILGGAQAGAGLAVRLTPLDDMSVMVVTGSPASVDTATSIIESLLSELGTVQLHRFPLVHVAADFAIDNILRLNGQVTQGARGIGQGGAIQGGAAAAGGVVGGVAGSLTNLSSRLFVDQGNAVIFRGTEAEAGMVTNLVAMVDVLTELRAQRYLGGSMVLEIATAGEALGLGRVEQAQAGQAGSFGSVGGFGARTGSQFGGGLRQFDTNEPLGSKFSVDLENGTLLYYGTDAQHKAVAKLVADLSEQAIGADIQIKAYKLLYAESEDVAELLNEIIQDPRQRTATSPFLGAQAGQLPDLPTPLEAVQGEGGGLDAIGGPEEGGEGGLDTLSATPDNTIIIADPARNQVLIKAPARTQDQFLSLIEKLDVRQPQVLIDVQIVSVTEDDDFDWTSELQVNIGDFFSFTNFGGLTAAEGATPFDPREIALNRTGLTAGILDNESVQYVLNTLATYANTKVLSRPQALVNDNQEATILSQREEPFSQASQGTATTIVSQGGVAEAGTTLTVVPRISKGGDLTMELNIELSSFDGQGQGGLQPPKNVDNYESTVTLPSDSTIIVGGFKLKQESINESGVPLLKDIPLLGNLFKSYRTEDTTRTVYVFITPRILNDPKYRSLEILTEGYREEAGAESAKPPMEPAMIPIAPFRDLERLIQVDVSLADEE